MNLETKKYMYIRMTVIISVFSEPCMWFKRNTGQKNHSTSCIHRGEKIKQIR